ncbi:MAG: hypothetical protein AAGI49_18525 [Bacteroidota bacterium]
MKNISIFSLLYFMAMISGNPLLGQTHRLSQEIIQNIIEKDDLYNFYEKDYLPMIVCLNCNSIDFVYKKIEVKSLNEQQFRKLLKTKKKKKVLTLKIYSYIFEVDFVKVKYVIGIADASDYKKTPLLLEALHVADGEIIIPRRSRCSTPIKIKNENRSLRVCDPLIG